MILLPLIKESTVDYEAIEKAIKDIFRKEIYLPLLQEFDARPNSRISNSKSVPGLLEALSSGRITFNRGVFSGKFNSEISKDLRALGAKFHRSTRTYRIQYKDLPREIIHAISSSESKFQSKIDAIDERLGDVIREEFLGKGISSKLKTDHLFDRTLWRVEKDFQKSIRNITIAPQLTPEQRKRISDEWGQNMQLWIKDFTAKEITELRGKMMDTVFAGDRYGSAIKTLQDSFGVTARKAKFLARQETSLLMTKFKQVRYQDAGINVYKWVCVKGTPTHPVRPMHFKNNGKYYRFDDPPSVDNEGHRRNPGQDYNCRCTARAAVNYKGKLG